MALTKAQREKLKRMIEERRAQVAEEVQRDSDKARAEPYPKLAEGPGDPGDQSNADLITHLTTEEISRGISELRDLDRAVARLAEDSYGTCVDCGADIPFERLAARPTAERCLRCQERREKTYAHPGEPTL